MYGKQNHQDDTQQAWIKLAALSFPLPVGTTVTASELEACLWGASFFLSWLEGPEASKVQIRNWETMDIKRLTILELAGLV